jgi:GntR family phosphonate transport system transcriptional regulator
MTVETLPLERGKGLAAWRQIAERLETDIAAAVWAAGEQLPPESAIAERFGVNRHTVRRALAALTQRGIVRATQGRGTFVEMPPLPYPIRQRTRFSEAVTQAGREASGNLIGSRVIAATEREAATLAVQPSADLLELRTIHRADDTPLSISRTLLQLPRFAGLDRTFAQTGSLTRAYAKHGVPDYVRIATRISARGASAEEAALLEMPAGRVVLVVDSVNAEPTGSPIQVTRALFAADRVEIVLEP